MEFTVSTCVKMECKLRSHLALWDWRFHMHRSSLVYTFLQLKSVLLWHLQIADGSDSYMTKLTDVSCRFAFRSMTTWIDLNSIILVTNFCHFVHKTFTNHRCVLSTHSVTKAGFCTYCSRQHVACSLNYLWSIYTWDFSCWMSWCTGFLSITLFIDSTCQAWRNLFFFVVWAKSSPDLKLHK